MGIEALNDDKIRTLLSTPKRVINPNARSKIKDKHVQRNYKVIDIETEGLNFNLFFRHNTIIMNDFSCGLVWNMPSGDLVTLTRYNGPSHNHKNSLEEERLGFNCHIHIATEKYIKAGKKPEAYAKITNSYSTANGVLTVILKPI